MAGTQCCDVDPMYSSRAKACKSRGVRISSFSDHVKWDKKRAHYVIGCLSILQTWPVIFWLEIHRHFEWQYSAFTQRL
jgi:hypothetical protein